VQIFGQDVKFSIAEDLRVKEHRKEQLYSMRVKTVNLYERSGSLAFEISSYADGCRKRWAEGKTQRVEAMLPQCVAGMMLVARTVRIWSDGIKKRQEEWKQREREQAEFVRLTGELDRWIAGWNKARQIREFVAAVESDCLAKGVPTSTDSPNEKRIAWALHRADGFDPLVEKEDSD
jgi:hypothetical protein